jgi:hypothetical protein
MSDKTLDIQNGLVSFKPYQAAAWFLMGFCSLLVVVGIILLFQPDILQHPESCHWESILLYTTDLVMVIIGTLIIRRYTWHPIGWLFNVIALLLILDMMAFSDAAYGWIVNPGSLPFAAVVAIVADDFSFIIQYGLILILILFPDGLFLSIRWRIFALIVGLMVVYAKIIWFLEPSVLQEFPIVKNPIGMNGYLHSNLRIHAGYISAYFIPFSLFASVSSVAIRFRSADEIVRQQIKWFDFGATPFVLGPFFLLIFQTQYPFGASTFIKTGLISAQFAIAIASLRYRLFDIDILINPSLVYGLLTTLIIDLYFLSLGISGIMVQIWDNLIGLLITSLVFAFFYKPINTIIQNMIERLVIGERKQPAHAP